MTNVTPGKQDVQIIYVDRNGTSSETNTTVNVPKWSSAVDFNVVDIKEGTVETVTIEVTGPKDGFVHIDIGGKGYYANFTNGKASIDISGLTVGDYTAVVSFMGDDTYDKSNATKTFKVTPGIKIDVGGSGNNTSINITVPGNATGNVTVIIDNQTYVVTNLTNGSAIINLTNMTPGEHNVTVIYTDANGTNTTADKVITISKYDTPIDIQVENIYVGDTTKVTVTVPEKATGDITITVGGKNYTASISKGVATFDVVGLDAGNTTVAAFYAGDDVYAFNASAANFTVLKRSSQISVSADNTTAGEHTVIKVSGLPSDATGYVIVKVNGTEYGINITKGEDSVSVLVIKAGKYTVVATYIGDYKYMSNESTTTFSADKATGKVDVTVKNGTVNDVVVEVNAPSDANGNVTVLVDNETKVVQNVTGGKNTIVVPDVGEGEHNVTVIYSGDDKYDSKKVTETVEIFSSIIVQKDLIRAYNSAYDYEAEFLDSEGHVLANTEVKIIVDGKEYNVKTDVKGTARLEETRLAIGKHNVTLVNPVTGQQVDESVNIVKRIVENNDVTCDFNDGTQYVVRAISDDGTPVGAGEVIGFHVNGVDYNGITDKNGYARLTINLNPKTYTITAQYRGYKVSNKVTVKQTLKLVKKTVTVKKSAKKLVIKAQLKWTNGKAIKGKKLTLKFKGKSYSAKTDSKGIAKFTIKKNVIKKLKKGKKYSYDVKYLTNKVKGTVKVKK